MTNLVVFGTSELARVLTSMAHEDPRYEVVAATAHRRFLDAMPDLPVPVCAYEDLTQLADPDQCELVVAIGYSNMNASRQQVCEVVTADGWRLGSYVSDRAWVSSDAMVGEGAIIFPHATVEPFAQLGQGVIMWSGATVCHDTVIGDYTYLAPSATICGNVRTGARCFIGAGATVRDGVQLATRTLVGAGACVLFPTEPDTVHRGVPATPIERTSSEISEMLPGRSSR
jgi:sugar O-acyltransferase (sialic acid O-acetyltransferase NeuD family)